jgi:cytochrome c-type biogenesis protein
MPLDVGASSLALSFGAGLASVASPCVLPVVPLLVSGTAEDHRARPALIVVGLAASFVAMGVLMSLFGAAIGPAVPRLEKVVGALVVVFGLLLLADVNLFKRLTWLSQVGAGTGGRLSGLVLGLSLGLVWIPCVGPMLSGVLATVATRGSLATGVVLLLAYAAGFAVPMLLVGYGSQALRQRVRAIAAHPIAVRWASGLLLVAFGAVILQRGMLFAGM